MVFSPGVYFGLFLGSLYERRSWFDFKHRCLMFRFYAVSLLLLLGCGNSDSKEKYPAGEQLSHPEVYRLPASLLEISGIAFPPGSSKYIYAVQDESGTVFRFIPGHSAVESIRFGKKGDYEDLVFFNEALWVLRSDGMLFAIPDRELDGAPREVEARAVEVLPKGEYESIAVSPSRDRLVVLCKECDRDKKANRATGYELAVEGTELLISAEFAIHEQDIEKYHSLKGRRFKPSAATYNKLSNEWMVVSAVNGVLVITDDSWQVKRVVRLPSGSFPQPEGIAIDQKGVLFISNEGKKKGEPATLMKFEMKK